MGQPLTITRPEHTAEALREFAAQSRDGAQVRRLLAIALILEGRSRMEAAELSGMDRHTLRDWLHRYNATGITGLTSRCSSGRPRALDEAQMAELKALVIKGPDPETDKVDLLLGTAWKGTVIVSVPISSHAPLAGLGR